MGVFGNQYIHARFPAKSGDLGVEYEVSGRPGLANGIEKEGRISRAG